jgi:hypothetical protein
MRGQRMLPNGGDGEVDVEFWAQAAANQAAARAEQEGDEGQFVISLLLSPAKSDMIFI